MNRLTAIEEVATVYYVTSDGRQFATHKDAFRYTVFLVLVKAVDDNIEGDKAEAEALAAKLLANPELHITLR